MSSIRGYFFEEDQVILTREEYDRWQAETEYLRNKVRQLEERSYLVQRGRDPRNGEIVWGTPAHGTERVDDGQG